MGNMHADYALCLSKVFSEDSTKVHGTIAPTIVCRDINRASIDTKELLKKGPVIIWFWSIRCGLRKPQVSMLKSLYRSYHGQGMTVIAVNEDDSKKSAGIAGAIKQNQFLFPVVLDKIGDVLRQFHTFSVPSVYVIRQDGYIV